MILNEKQKNRVEVASKGGKPLQGEIQPPPQNLHSLLDKIALVANFVQSPSWALPSPIILLTMVFSRSNLSIVVLSSVVQRENIMLILFSCRLFSHANTPPLHIIKDLFLHTLIIAKQEMILHTLLLLISKTNENLQPFIINISDMANNM